VEHRTDLIVKATERQETMPRRGHLMGQSVDTHRKRFPALLLIILNAVIAVVVLMNLYGAHLARERTQEERQAIQDVLDAQVAAWNRCELEAFMTGYWHSPELTFFSGKDKMLGWQAALDRYRKRYQAEGRDKMGALSFSEIKIELLGPDSGFVRGRWKLVTSKEPLGGLFTLLLRKKPEGWRIVHDHTSG
jgi:ketosteroid isomerase-like protein